MTNSTGLEKWVDERVRYLQGKMWKLNTSLGKSNNQFLIILGLLNIKWHPDDHVIITLIKFKFSPRLILKWIPTGNKVMAIN